MMEAAHKPASAHELSLSSNSQQAPLTVNPKYPLPSPLLPPQAPGRTSLPDAVEGNGISRISSRRRRVSGKSQMDSISHATMVESPKLPPLSYRDPYGNGTSDGPTTRNSTSFAERIRAAPSGLISAHIPNDDFDPMIQRTASNRRGSLNRPPGTLYAAVQSSSRASYPSTNIGTTVPLVSPNDPIPTPVQAPDTQAPQNTSRGSTQIPRYQEDSVHATSRPTSRRVSAGVADRSPLQDLEVKLNDISKGGKRARVEEAEQLLKESRSGARGPTFGQDVDSIVNTKQVGRSSADQGGKLRSRLADESRQGHVEGIERRGQDISTNTRSKPEKQSVQSLLQSEIQQSPLRRNPNPQSDSVKVPAPSKLPLSFERNRKSLTRAVQASEHEQDPGRAPIEDPSAITKLDQDIESTVGKPNRIIKLVKPGFPLPLENVPVLARLERPSGDQVAMGTNLSKQTSRQQKPSSRENTDKPKSNNSLPSDQATLNPAKLLSKDRNRDASTYLKLPHPSDETAAGKQSGSSHSPLEVPEGTVHNKYHLGNFLQHSHHHDPNFQGGPAAKPSRLDEWRRAETARLTAADVNPGNETAKKQSAWWESIGSNVYHSANAKVRNKRDVQSLDGGYDELYGKTSLSPSRQNRSMEFLPQISYSINAAHARRYIANDEVDQGREESWLRGHAHLHAKEKHIGLSTAYSHSCPHLDEHDGSHPYHICKPYMSKELIKSMRAIRIRAAPPTASFNPPLYLKCGPLLRYTGLDRQVPANGAADSSSKNGLERELWRGSVMIVTVDADSSYNPPPVLRLFPEPIDLLPPPPEPVDDGSGHSLPSEYIDPIAGLPKLSRTGKTVYVKPVEDLEEQVDLSRVEDDGGLFEETRTAAVPTSYGQPSSRPRGDLSSQPISTSGGRRERDNSIRYQKAKGVKLHAERGVTFWRFSLEIELTERQVRIAYRINNGASVGFWIPARGQTMNVMFHTCNGFSMSINPDQFSGPDPLWRDVLNSHQIRPFHVMIGGGDQIYNDSVMNQTTLFHEWLGTKNPLHKHEAQFTTQMQEELETFYLERYSMWFSQGLFGMANSQIPMINMWDDHGRSILLPILSSLNLTDDIERGKPRGLRYTIGISPNMCTDIIDGFGSYPDHFMRSPVFCGVGTVAFKYYLLFQHQSVVDEGMGDEPSWLLGASPGPYIKEHSRSVFMFLGRHVAFLGLDCRTERMREEILSENSYNLAFERCRREIIKGETKHLLVLLGVPIAYPRLVWLENLLTSKVMDPIKALGRAGVLGSFLNKFDGGVEILDDLDDHWTSKNHKAERNWFVQELQEIAAEKSVRVTYLSGDVHMAAVGQFFSNSKLQIPKDQDHRYMANVISSAIVNAPPPEMMGDILNKRNKLHHLDHETDESMIPIFTHDVDRKPRSNKHLLPRRNWCSIREYHPDTTPPSTAPSSELPTPNEVHPQQPNRLQRTLSLTRNDVKPSNLLRRLSQRGPPPSLKYPPSNQYRSSPPTDVSQTVQSPTEDGYFSMGNRPALQEVNSNGNPFSLIHRSSAPAPRPGNFHRRPTIMGKKGSSKGGNNEIHGHINLQYGLDIIINCEVSQRDPAGITFPYRLLVPTLWYQGIGDQNDTPFRRKSWIRRLGSINKSVRKKSDLAKGQGVGEWGGIYSDESRSQSNSESEAEIISSPVVEYAQRNRNAVDFSASSMSPVEIGGTNTGRKHMRPEVRSAYGNGDPGSSHIDTRRLSEVEDILGMAGPAEKHGRVGDSRLANSKGIASDRFDEKDGNMSRSNTRSVAPRFEGGGVDHIGSDDGLARRKSRGYDGIEAYKERRWRRFF